MKSVQIKERLIQNEDLLINVLEKYGFCYIKKIKQDEIRCAYDEDSNPTSVVINLDNLFCTIWSKNVRGDIYSILQFNSGQSFSQVHNYLSSLFDGEEVEEIKPKKLLFNGFFKQFIGSEQKEQVYDERILSEYKSIPNIRFIEDNISAKTQRKFEIGYDYQSHFITIPVRNTEGNLVGIKGRRNYDDEDKPKYLALRPFKKSDYLYGMYQNYDKIVSERRVMLFEAEKSTMICDSFKFNCCASVMGHDISEQQIRTLRYNVDTIVFAYDKDVEENILINECKKVKKILPNVKVGYILDENNLLDEKMSPVDNGYLIFKQLIRNNIIWYRGDKNER